MLTSCLLQPTTLLHRSITRPAPHTPSAGRHDQQPGAALLPALPAPRYRGAHLPELHTTAREPLLPHPLGYATEFHAHRRTDECVPRVQREHERKRRRTADGVCAASAERGEGLGGRDGWWRRRRDSGECGVDRKSTRLNSSHSGESRMPSSA